MKLCNVALKDCQAVEDLLKVQLQKQDDIVKTQTTEIVSQKVEIEHVKSSSVLGKVVFGVLGIVVGLVLHIPLALIVK